VREFSVVPVLILTDCGKGQDKVRALDVGTDDYLTKPSYADELLACIRAIVRRKQRFARAQSSSYEEAAIMPTTTTFGDLAHESVSAYFVC
jgi:two-component system KDP operon response regulator KdpE